jgi:hypothetical protein
VHNCIINNTTCSRPSRQRPLRPHKSGCSHLLRPLAPDDGAEWHGDVHVLGIGTITAGTCPILPVGCTPVNLQQQGQAGGCEENGERESAALICTTLLVAMRAGHGATATPKGALLVGSAGCGWCPRQAGWDGTASQQVKR